MAQPTEEGLVRGIGRWDLVAVAINGIIGAGIFGLPSKVFALIGPYSVIAFTACAASSHLDNRLLRGSRQPLPRHGRALPLRPRRVRPGHRI